MSYTPQPGTNIWKIYQTLPDHFVSYAQFKELIKSTYPDVPQASYHTHLNFLSEKNLVVIKTEKGIKYFSKKGQGETKPIIAVATPSTPALIIEHLRNHVGKRIHSKEIKERFSKTETDNFPLDVLRKLKDMGAIQHIEGTRPYEYLVLPEIMTVEKLSWSTTKKKTISKKNKELVSQPKPEKQEKYMTNNDLANMTMSEMLSDYVATKAENQKLRMALQRIAHELLEVGEIEN